MIALAHRVILAEGWQRRLIALISGAVGALALPPVTFLPAIVVPMTVAVWLVDGSAQGVSGKAGERSLRASMSSLLYAALYAAAAGWWWGFGYFLAGLWWLGAAFLVEADQFAWALPLGVFALPAALAFFPALGFALARLIWSSGAARILALAAGLGASEWLRGHVLTGFPWNCLGMTLGGNLVLGQFASVVGLYGLTFLAIAIFASPAVLADPRPMDVSTRLRMNRSFVAALVCFLALAAFGAIRLASASPGNVKGVKLRIMQPNLQQDARFRPENKDAILRHYLTLSDRATSPQTSGLADVTHLIWPESAFPFILSRDPQALAQIGSALPPGVVLITGAARIGESGQSANAGARSPQYHNSIQVVASGGTILGTYDKVHLVPFGEYLPLGGLLERVGLRQFVHIPGGFEPGSHRGILTVPGLPAVSPLVCYEAIFPGEVTVDHSGQTAVLLNVTNDGWFGQTSGPYQHLAQARLRSIEEGVPLIRAANTGISAIVDPYGRILNQIPLGVEDVLDGPLPQRIQPTLFARHGGILS